MSERPLTYDHLRSQKKPVTKTISIVLDSEVADRYDEAKQEWELAKARLAMRPEDGNFLAEVESSEAKYQEAKTAAEATTVEFKFKGLGRRKFEELIDKHPPTPDQISKAKRMGQGDINWNTDTFPIALVALCCVSPELQESDVKEMWDSDDWSGSETLDLFLAAMSVNQNHRRIDLGKD